MPNWKSYESSVRLLSAIVAAHPELKLNYNAIADSGHGGGVGSAQKAAPRKRAAPKKAAAKKVDRDDDEDSDGNSTDISDDKQFLRSETPVKSANKSNGKITNNKVMTGRVGKTTPSRAARPQPGRFTGLDDDEEEDEEEGEEGDDQIATSVKKEDGYGPMTSHNGNGNGYGEKGYSSAPIRQPQFGAPLANPYDHDDDDAGVYYDADAYDEA